MSHLKRDVTIGAMFLIGITGFISGEFVISTFWFAAAAIYSNVYLSRKQHG